MKKIFYLATCVLLLASCNNGPTQEQYDALKASKDSLEMANAQMEDVITTVNGAMNEMAADESLLFVDDEGKDLKDKNAVLTRLQTFRNHMSEQRAQIDKLKKQLGGSYASNKKLKDMIETLNQQIAEKDAQLAELQAQLEDKNTTIADLKNQLAIITTAKQQVETERDHFIDVAKQQDIELNTAYYIVDTKKSLKEAGLVAGVFKKKARYENMDASKFTKVDVREFKQLTIDAKSPKLITVKPEDSYKLVPNADGTTTLTITNAAKFWDGSPYLVIQK